MLSQTVWKSALAAVLTIGCDGSDAATRSFRPDGSDVGADAGQPGNPEGGRADAASQS